MTDKNNFFLEGDVVEVKYSDKLWYEAKVKEISDARMTVTFTDESWDGGPYNTIKQNIRSKGLFNIFYPAIQVLLDGSYIDGILSDEEGEGLWTVQLVGCEDEDDIEFLYHIPESQLQYNMKMRNQIYSDRIREETDRVQLFLNFSLEQIQANAIDSKTIKRIDKNDPRLDKLNHCKFSDHAADRGAERVEHMVEVLRGLRYATKQNIDIYIHMYIYYMVIN